MLKFLTVYIGLSVLFQGTFVDGGCCKDNWLPFQESCYYFGHDAVHFTEAEGYCRQHGGHLIHINNKIEGDFIKTKVGEMRVEDWWLGLTDEDIHGLWKWFDTDEIAEYTDWGTDQPQDNSEHCAGLLQYDSYGWHDVTCAGRLLVPLCEMPSGEDSELIG